MAPDRITVPPGLVWLIRYRAVPGWVAAGPPRPGGGRDGMLPGPDGPAGGVPAG